MDLIQSNRPAALAAVMRWLPVAGLTVALLPLAAFLVGVVVGLIKARAYVASTMVGLIGILLVVAAYFVLRKVADWLESWDPKLEATEHVVKTQRAAAGFVVVLVALLILGSLVGGMDVVGRLQGRAWTATGTEVLVAALGDRAVLADLDAPPVSGEATLTGGFRVVPLPSDLRFQPHRIFRLKGPAKP
jgi:membrane-associated protease RseP (regulator of RpoE activity)